jgi:hypothetical protein
MLLDKEIATAKKNTVLITFLALYIDSAYGAVGLVLREGVDPAVLSIFL